MCGQMDTFSSLAWEFSNICICIYIFCYLDLYLDFWSLSRPPSLLPFLLTTSVNALTITQDQDYLGTQ